MNRPNDTAASVHHLRFSGARIRAFMQFSPEVSVLVLTKLAAGIGPASGTA